MEGQIQQFVTLRFDDLWLDVPYDTFVNASSESWKTTAASPTEKEKEKEVSSAPRDGFVPVMSKSAKRRMRAAARASTYEQHVSVHKTAPSDSVPPSFAKTSGLKLASQGAPKKFQSMLEEWPVLAKRTAPLKIISSARSASSPVTPTRHEPDSWTTSTKVAVPLTPSKLKVGAPSKALHDTSGVGSYKPTSNTLAQHIRPPR
uniref:Uncharacterized protein n=1 Tax=Hordeum vulgare subsp. vulgare TaxID=112509 RepID=A0A8I6YCY5_HORVV